jgi:hypothetical protein
MSDVASFSQGWSTVAAKKMAAKKTKVKGAPVTLARSTKTKTRASVSKAGKGSTTGIGIADWVQLVNDAVQAEEADVVRNLQRKAAKWDLPIDLANACEDDKREKAIDAAFKAMNKSLDKRIKAVDPISKLSFELCCLRDMICSS